jgi:hypothetical protein
MGLFSVLTRHLIGESCVPIKTPADLFHLLQPQSNSRTGFWKSVVSTATEFFLAQKNEEKVFNLIKDSECEEAHFRSSQSSQNYRGERSPTNSKVKEEFAGIATEVVLEFFEKLKSARGLDRGEVLHQIPIF